MPLQLGPSRMPFSMIPDLLFFRSYRPADFYRAELEALGFRDIEVQHLQLDVPFFIVSGRK